MVGGTQVWRVSVEHPGPAVPVYTPPAGKGLWGFEIGADDRFYAALGEERGDLYRLPLPP